MAFPVRGTACEPRLLVRLAAARSPFYRAWFREAGLDPESVRTVAGLARLPLLYRSDLVTEAERFLVYPDRLMWQAHSGGTSGAVIDPDDPVPTSAL